MSSATPMSILRSMDIQEYVSGARIGSLPPKAVVQTGNPAQLPVSLLFWQVVDLFKHGSVKATTKSSGLAGDWSTIELASSRRRPG